MTGRFDCRRIVGSKQSGIAGGLEGKSLDPRGKLERWLGLLYKERGYFPHHALIITTVMTTMRTTISSLSKTRASVNFLRITTMAYYNRFGWCWLIFPRDLGALECLGPFFFRFRQVGVGQILMMIDAWRMISEFGSHTWGVFGGIHPIRWYSRDRHGLCNLCTPPSPQPFIISQ